MRESRENNKSGLFEFNSKKVSKRITALAVIAIGLAFSVGVTWMVRAHNQPVASLSDTAVSPVNALVPNPLRASLKPTQKPARIETEIITILPDGFQPKEVTRPFGRFNLMVDNRSGLADVSLQLDREAGSRLQAVQVNRSQLDWNDVFDLTPGKYTLTEANHSEWVCRITITAR